MECEDTLHPGTHMMFCQKLIKEMTDAAAVIMAHLSLKKVIQRWNGKGRAAAKYDTKKLHFRDTFNTKEYKQLNKYQNENILESQIFLKEKRDVII